MKWMFVVWTVEKDWNETKHSHEIIENNKTVNRIINFGKIYSIIKWGFTSE